MDILTPKGQQSRSDEIRAVEIFNSKYGDFTYLETPKDSPAIVDAVLIRGKTLYSVVETKCRYNLTINDFMNKFGGTWILTHEKLEKARQIACSLGVGLTGFLYLKSEDALLLAQIANKDGLYIRKIEIEATKTQRTINGGTIVRNNAYIDMKNAEILRINKNYQV
jgi:hypothetical protein